MTSKSDLLLEGHWEAVKGADRLSRLSEVVVACFGVIYGLRNESRQAVRLENNPYQLILSFYFEVAIRF